MASESVIGQGTVVRGHVRGEGSIEVLGRVEGDVAVTGDVTIGENAAVRGGVTGARLAVAGTVDGDLTGSEAVVLDASAQVAGDIVAPRIGIAEGARVRGAVRTDAEGRTGARSTAGSRGRPAEVPRASKAEVKAIAKPAERRPPAPVVPVLRKARGLKKKAR